MEDRPRGSFVLGIVSGVLLVVALAVEDSRETLSVILLTLSCVVLLISGLAAIEEQRR